jgi:mRNA-degrading endonuclease RelE of RelBE toxin-antitoxin system
MTHYPSLEFIRLFSFERSIQGLFSEQDILELELVLMIDPRIGRVIPHGKGLRKLRRPLPGRGKSSGARVIYYYLNQDHTVYLVFAYAKNKAEILTPRQVQQLAQLISEEIP